jgi:trimeric autotransporter adhesin
LTITNTESYQGTGNPRPFAITGIGSGATSGGVLGTTTNIGGIGVYGEAGTTSNTIAVYGETTQVDSEGVYGSNSGAGFAGFFLLDGANTVQADSAVYAENRGGSTTKAGDYGPAANFAVTNAENQSSAIVASTNGAGNTIHGIQTGTSGSAGQFEIDDATNASDGLVVTTAGTGTGIMATIADTTDVGQSAVAGIDNSASGSFTHAIYGRSNHNVAVYGTSTGNVSAQFVGGSSGSGACSYSGGPGWSCSSDRNLKEAFAPIETGALLEHLAAMPVFTYRFKNSKDKSVFLGPTAQDFMAAFHLGNGDDTKINEANAIGVALAATKGVYAKLRQDEATIAADRDKIATLEMQLAAEQKAAMAKAVRNEDRLTRLEAAMTRFSQIKSSRLESLNMR